jgi:hypothetical protein
VRERGGGREGGERKRGAREARGERGLRRAPTVNCANEEVDVSMKHWEGCVG